MQGIQVRRGKIYLLLFSPGLKRESSMYCINSLLICLYVKYKIKIYLNFLCHLEIAHYCEFVVVVGVFLGLSRIFLRNN